MMSSNSSSSVASRSVTAGCETKVEVENTVQDIEIAPVFFKNLIIRQGRFGRGNHLPRQIEIKRTIKGTDDLMNIFSNVVISVGENLLSY